MNEHQRRAFEREGKVAKVVIVVLLLILAVVAALLLWLFRVAPYTSPFP